MRRNGEENGRSEKMRGNEKEREGGRVMGGDDVMTGRYRIC